jgi:hypothetical protein
MLMALVFWDVTVSNGGKTSGSLKALFYGLPILEGEGTTLLRNAGIR